MTKKIGRKSLREQWAEPARTITVVVRESVYNWLHDQPNLNVTGVIRTAIYEYIKKMCGKDFSK